MEWNRDRRVKYMFAILDRFHRDSVYKNIRDELDFEQYADDFCESLNKILKNTSSSHLTTYELQFRDYADTIEELPDIARKIKPQYRVILKSNHTIKAIGVDRKCSLLFFACSQAIPSDKDERRSLKCIIDTLIEKCPEMVKHPVASQEDERCGPTPLHLMVVKDANTKAEKEFKHDIIKKMLCSSRGGRESVAEDLDLDKFIIKGEMARGLLLRGKTLLNIAARTLDMSTLDLLLRPPEKEKSEVSEEREITDDKNETFPPLKCHICEGPRSPMTEGPTSMTWSKKYEMRLESPLSFDSYNDYKDNMYHSLIRYTIFFPEKEKDVIYFMINIEKFLRKSKTRAIDPSKRGRPDSLWLMKNKENLTPLQLAAKMGRFELFQFILERKVYRLNAGDRGHFDDESYDVTEIETIPVENDDRKQTKEEKEENTLIHTERHTSILHLLEQFVPEEKSARFVSVGVVGKLISDKWYAYKMWILVWALIHILVMGLFSWQAVLRSRLINPMKSQSATIPEYNNVTFVIASNTLAALYGILCLFLQCMYYYFYCYNIWKSFPLVSYGHAFSLFGIGMVLDFFLIMFSSSCDNFILPFILILGWYLLIFFLHVVEQFSFFTILIKDVVKHLVQFGVVLSALLVGFSTAMFVVMQNADDIEEDTFENIEKTIVEMFTIMLGIGELGVLFNARQPVLAVIIFVLFVPLTTILLLNALIAIMSNTCSPLTDEASMKTYVRLQRMYTIINLEAMLPSRFLCPAAEQVSQIRHNRPGETTERRILSLRPEDDDNIDST